MLRTVLEEKVEDTKVYLRDYKVPPYLIQKLNLELQLDKKETVVTSHLEVKINPESKETVKNLKLDGKDLKLKSIKIDGRELTEKEYIAEEDGSLTLLDVPPSFELDIENTVCPETNTELLGLYVSDDVFVTHCESEGFRNITYFVDRPDNLAVYTTKVIASKAACKVLISNGNLIDAGDLPDGKHFTQWLDPFKKASYLFAAVGGNLEKLPGIFKTMSGKYVNLEIYADASMIERCHLGMGYLQDSMKWDEERFGLECDLDTYKIVGIRDFNAGAMENKGLNIFNSSSIVADITTSTDWDFEQVRDTIAHEYFHNWTGNRVTNKNWPQLAVKEGLTTFRHHSFAEDHSGVSARIEQVNYLRNKQFVVDKGPKAHPVQTQSYEVVDNCYTTTVYEKGAEIFRMMEVFLGRNQFRDGLRLYLKRHDGQGATIEDFVQAQSDSSKKDLSQFLVWFKQAGTPIVDITDDYNPVTHIYTLKCKQKTLPTPGEPVKKSVPIPIKLGLLNSEGDPMALDATGTTDKVLMFNQEYQEFRFRVPHKPVPSLFRGFSAPVYCNYNYTNDELAMLSTCDEDIFNRWNASREYQKKTLRQLIQDYKTKNLKSFYRNLDEFIFNYQNIVESKMDDQQVQSWMMSLPRMMELFEDKIDVDTYVKVAEYVRYQIGKQLQPILLNKYRELQTDAPPSKKFNKLEAAARCLKNMCLSLLVKSRDPKLVELAHNQFDASLGKLMTDNLGAFEALNDTGSRAIPLEAFKKQWIDNPDVMDNWLEMQANSTLPDTFENVKRIVKDVTVFDITNPNNIRCLLNRFTLNVEHFHHKSGEAYKFITDMILTIDSKNPIAASGLSDCFADWKRFDEHRSKLMKQQLERIYNHPGLSKNVSEGVKKMLGIGMPEAQLVNFGLFKSKSQERAVTPAPEMDVVMAASAP